MTTTSILDIIRYSHDHQVGDSIRGAQDLALHAEALGYERYWIAEHHNMPGIASTATAVLVGQIAAATRTIRVGAGGIMLPNHAPFVIAEQFGTLAHMFPGRIDLGLGRSSGTDEPAVRALRRSPNSANDFPRDVLELQSYFAPVRPGQAVEAIPAAGTNVPLWILGSSTFGAQLAAQLGLPFGFGSHFAPDLLLPALEIYRANFKPSAQSERPWVMTAINVIVADSDAEAEKLASSQRMAFVDMLRTRRVHLKPPIANIDQYWNPMEKTQVMRMLACSAIGSPTTVRKKLDEILAQTRADELMIATDVYDHSARRRSLELLADVMRDIKEAG